MYSQHPSQLSPLHPLMVQYISQDLKEVALLIPFRDSLTQPFGSIQGSMSGL